MGPRSYRRLGLGSLRFERNKCEPRPVAVSQCHASGSKKKGGCMKVGIRETWARGLAMMLPGLLTAISAAAQTNAESLISNSFVVNAGAFIVGTDVRAR